MLSFCVVKSSSISIVLIVGKCEPLFNVNPVAIVSAVVSKYSVVLGPYGCLNSLG
jgi:hypothetical protein